MARMIKKHWLVRPGGLAGPDDPHIPKDWDRLSTEAEKIWEPLAWNPAAVAALNQPLLLWRRLVSRDVDVEPPSGEVGDGPSET